LSRPFIPKRFLGAFKAGHRYSSREFIDESLPYQLLKKIIESNYEDKESIYQLEFLTKFNNEYHKAVIKKGDADAFHNTDELRKERYTANNHRNVDVMSCQKLEVIFTITDVDKYRTSGVFRIPNAASNEHEDVMMDLLGAMRKFRMN